MADSPNETLLSIDRMSKRNDDGKDFRELSNSTAQKDRTPSKMAVERENMKLFDFGKLDDFEFDAEFGKLPSFKLDMPELDFSSPQKMPAMPKEGSKAQVTRGKPEKKSGFSFSFDFNELNSFDIDSKITQGENKLNRKHGELKMAEQEISDFSETETTKRDSRNKSSSAEFDINRLVKGLPSSQLKPKTSDRGKNFDNQPEQQLADENLTLEIYMPSTKFLQQTESNSSSSAKLQSILGEEQTNSIRLFGSTRSKKSNENKGHDAKQSLAYSSEKLPSSDRVLDKRQVEQGNAGSKSRELPQMQSAVGKNSLSPLSSKSPSRTSSSEKLNPGSRLLLTFPRDDFSPSKDGGSIKSLSLARNKLENAGAKLSTLISPKQLYATSNRKTETTSANILNSKPAGESAVSAESGSATDGFNSSSFDLGLQNDSSSSKIKKNEGGKNNPSLDLSIKKTVSSNGLVNMANAASTGEKSRNFIKNARKSPLSASNAGTIKTDPEVNSEGTMLKTVPLRSLSGSLERRALLSPSLKRKSLEVDTANPTSPKRGQRSPTEKRKCLQISPTIIYEPTDLLKHAKGDSSFDDIDHFVSLEIPALDENDGTIEKAEACAKELENICSMLRKKQDEAKELLVRAIVTNNSLLMLDHPLYEEKIHSLQRLAASALGRKFSD